MVQKRIYLNRKRKNKLEITLEELKRGIEILVIRGAEYEPHKITIPPNSDPQVKTVIKDFGEFQLQIEVT